MRRIKLVGLACLALLALATAMASSASAAILPEILPLSAKERTWTGEDDSSAKESKLVSTTGGTIVCTEATATGTEEAGKPLGLFHIAFKNCTAEGIKCKTSPDVNGTILSLGTWHLVYDKLTPELLTATWFLPEAITIECSALVKIKVLAGGVLCLDLPLLENKRHFLFHCNQTAGVPEDKEVFNLGDKEKSVGKSQLLCEFNGAKAAECAEQALGLVLYPEGTSLTVDS